MLKITSLSLIAAMFLFTGCDSDTACCSNIASNLVSENPTQPDTNQSPIVNAGVDVTITEGDNVTLVATANDSDGTITTYEWKEGGVVKGNSTNLTLNNLSVGIHFFTITVTDDKGKTANDIVKVEVEAKATIAQALLGPLSKANFDITLLGETTPIVSGTTTLGDGDNVTSAGLIRVPQDTIDNIVPGMYVIAVTGGTDIDYDDNLVWDETPTPNRGTLHAFVNDTQFANGDFKVNILTDMVYSNLIDEITVDINQTELESQIKIKAKQLLKDDPYGDVNGNGVIDGDDILAWNPAADKNKLRVHYDRVIGLIADKVLDDGDIVEDVTKLFISITSTPIAPDSSLQLIGNTIENNITLSGTDADGDVLTFTIATSPPNGILGGTAPNLTYTPNNGYVGSDSFTYTVNDGVLDSDIGTVNLVIVEPNRLPIATAQSVTTNEDTTKNIILSGTDIDEDTLTYSIVTEPSNGTFASGVYTPNTNFSGTDSFTFTANDGSLTSSSATVSVTVNSVNDTPIATAQSVTLDEDTTKNITLSGTDIDEDILTYSIVTEPSNGTFASGVYTPNADYFGSDSFTFTANDGSLTSSSATISITITDVAEPNQPPTVDAGADANITVGDNYTPSPTSNDPDGTITTTVWKQGTTTLTFPKSDFTVGIHTLTVTVTDDDGATATDTLTVTVNSNCTPLHKTGQTTSHHNNDDGDYQKGATRSYTRDDVNQIVTDNVTNLMWQDNESITKSWDTATGYCSNLTLGTYSDWRLPTIEELVYLVDRGRTNLAIDPKFQSIVSGYYWSSTTLADNSNFAWIVYFYYGYDFQYFKSASLYVRCVRDGQ